MLHYAQNNILEVVVRWKAQMRFAGYVKEDRVTGMSEEGSQGCRHSFGSWTGRTTDLRDLSNDHRGDTQQTIHFCFRYVSSPRYLSGLECSLIYRYQDHPRKLKHQMSRSLTSWSTLDLIPS